MITRFAFSILAATILTAGSAAARDQLRIVGAPSVLPFAAAAAEQVKTRGEAVAPIMEQTDSAMGLDLFCGGIGVEHPDIVGASRRMTADEWRACQENGVVEIIEAKIGFDGIVLGGAASGPDFDLSSEDLFEALSARTLQYGRLDANRSVTWKQIDPTLPMQPIRVYGPPPGAEERAAFEALALRAGGRDAGLDRDDIAALHLREDGTYRTVEGGDAAIAARVQADPDAMGLFSFRVLGASNGRIKPVAVDGISPNADTITLGDYPLSRALYVYAKKAHIGLVPGLESYLDELASKAATGAGGYAAQAGLIPLPGDEREALVATIADHAVMTGDEKL